MANRVVDRLLPVAVSAKGERPHIEREPRSANSCSSVFGQAIEERGDDPCGPLRFPPRASVAPETAALAPSEDEPQQTSSRTRYPQAPQQGSRPSRWPPCIQEASHRCACRRFRRAPPCTFQAARQPCPSPPSPPRPALRGQSCNPPQLAPRRCSGTRSRSRWKSRCSSHPPETRGGEAADVAHGVVSRLHLRNRSCAHTGRRIRAASPRMERRHAR